MSNQQALGYFMDYCNRNMGTVSWVDDSTFQRGMTDIMMMPEGTFSSCSSAEDVIKILGYK